MNDRATHPLSENAKSRTALAKSLADCVPRDAAALCDQLAGALAEDW
jgi:hypothetical protein